MKTLEWLREHCGITLEDKGAVDTRRGKRHLHAGEPTEAFWEEWNKRKDELKQSGITVRVVKYEVCAWLGPDGEEKDIPAGSRKTASD